MAIQEGLRRNAGALLGIEIPHGKRRKYVDFYDSDSGSDLLRTSKAVDVTQVFTGPQRDKTLLYFARHRVGTIVVVEVRNRIEMTRKSTVFRLNDEAFHPTDPSFQLQSDRLGIDPDFLHAVILANQPKPKG